MKFEPDYRFQEAEEAVNKIAEKNLLVKYYLKKQEEQIKREDEKLREYYDFFNLLGKLIPRRNDTKLF